MVSDEAFIEENDPASGVTDEIELVIRNFTFRPGRYSIRIILHDSDTSYNNTCDVVESAMELDVLSNDFFASGKTMRSHDQSGLMQAFFKYM